MCTGKYLFTWLQCPPSPLKLPNPTLNNFEQPQGNLESCLAVPKLLWSFENSCKGFVQDVCILCCLSPCQTVRFLRSNRNRIEDFCTHNWGAVQLFWLSQHSQTCSSVSIKHPPGRETTLNIKSDLEWEYRTAIEGVKKLSVELRVGVAKELWLWNWRRRPRGWAAQAILKRLQHCSNAFNLETTHVLNPRSYVFCCFCALFAELISNQSMLPLQRHAYFHTCDLGFEPSVYIHLHEWITVLTFFDYSFHLSSLLFKSPYSYYEISNVISSKFGHGFVWHLVWCQFRICVDTTCCRKKSTSNWLMVLGKIP